MHPTCGTRECQKRPARYPTDCADAEWQLIAPLLPQPAAKTATGGHPEGHCRRIIWDAIGYVCDNGIKWRSLPADFPPWETVYGCFARWRRRGVLQHLNDVLRERLRRAEGRLAEPSAAAIDSQSVKGDATVGAATRGYDGGKKINGRKRHIAVDTLGLLLIVMVTAANTSDRTAAYDLLLRLRQRYETVRHVWADGGYTGKIIGFAADVLEMTVEIVNKLAGQTTFVVLHRRWVVERTFSWITNRRRNSRDYERLPETSEAFIYWSSIMTMTRRLSKMA